MWKNEKRTIKQKSAKKNKETIQSKGTPKQQTTQTFRPGGPDCRARQAENSEHWCLVFSLEVFCFLFWCRVFFSYVVLWVHLFFLCLCAFYVWIVSLCFSCWPPGRNLWKLLFKIVLKLWFSLEFVCLCLCLFLVFVLFSKGFFGCPFFCLFSCVPWLFLLAARPKPLSTFRFCLGFLCVLFSFPWVSCFLEVWIVSFVLFSSRSRVRE